jgi:DNA-binding NtrC family response regulator
MMDRIRVLVVDDEPEIVRELSVLLCRRGFDVQTADSVAGARQALTEEVPPHIVLSDVRMPGGSGLDLLDDDLGAIGIIYVSGHLEGAEAKAVLKRGALAVLAKPVDTRRLVALLREHGGSRAKKG